MSTTKNAKRASRRAAPPCSPVPYSEEWWAIIEEGRFEPAKRFGPETAVMSRIAARALVVEAVARLKANAPRQVSTRSGDNLHAEVRQA